MDARQRGRELITGPTGNVGAELTRLLSSQDEPPRFRMAAHHSEQVRAEYGDDLDVAHLD